VVLSSGQLLPRRACASVKLILVIIQCKKHQAATKKLEIYKAPDILVICIKRFGSSRRLSDKLDNMVQFPVDGLDLEERVGERKLAKSLKLSDGELKEMGIEEGNEPMIYDLCEFC
jgi:ubiquitin carboxyl-terminal hydrolase 4/11/15